MVEAQTPCGFCMSYRPGGSMTIRRDARAAEQSWVSVQLIASDTLCGQCFEWFGSLLRAAATGSPLKPVGAPHPTETPAPHGDACDLCRAHLNGDSFAIELVPRQREMLRRDLFRFDSRLRQYRLCGGCLAWARSIEYDESAVTGTSVRAGIGPVSEWQSPHAAHACTAFLLPDDEGHVAALALQSGHSYRKAPRRTGIRTQVQGELFFIGSGSARQAASVIEQLTPEERLRACVVARFETLGDAREALALGAAEMLVSPLSPQQLGGAAHRARERLTGAKVVRNGDGLPTLQPGPDRPGRPGQLLSITTPRHATMETMWLLRRFLRGDDRVGFGQREGLVAQVFCPDDHVEAVRGRLIHLLGERASVRELGRTESALKKTA